jgi:hypothetical protein
MKKQILNKKIIIGISLLALFALFYFFFFFKPTEAQVCLPLTGYIVWPGTWEPGRIPMASTSQYYLAPSPLFVSGSNVGIGTTNPVYKLQVQGSIYGESLCMGNPPDCRSVWPGGGTTGGSGTPNYLAKWTASTTLGNSIIYDNGTNVGIGTTNPDAKLRIAGGGIRLDAGQTISTPGRLHIQAENENLYLNPWSGTTYVGYGGGPGNLFVSGNVGIGTTAPAGRLHVVGGRTYLDGGASIGTSSTFRTLTAAGEIHSTGGVSGFSTTDRADGDATTRRWVMYAYADFLRFWTEGIGDRVVFGRNGNVGIGTTAPGQKLDVVGGYIRSDTGFCIGTSCITSWPGGGGVSGSGTTNYIAKWTGSTSLGNSIIYDNGTNVGIGTTAPGQKLTVAGNIDVTGNRILNLATPINASDAATKGYVDAQVANARPANWDCVLVSAYTAPDGTPPTAQCPAGYKLITGGCDMNIFEPDIAGGSYFPWVSRPANNGWYCSNNVGWGEWAYAWCCR